MNLEEIKGLINIVEKSSLTEFTIRDKDMKISMSKLNPTTIQLVSTENVGTVPETKQSMDNNEGEAFITSPIVGTFYSSPSPDMPSFVKVGDKVKVGETLCILEAMKMMNNIECDYDCEIEEVLVSNEQRVGYGQVLFRVKKN